MFRLRIAVGNDRAVADRSVLWTAAALVPLAGVEFFASLLTVTDDCIQGETTAPVAHLAVAGVALVLTGAAGRGR